MKTLKLVSNKIFFIVIISIIGFIVVGAFLYNIFRTYEAPNAKVGELSFPNSSLKVFYSHTDKENTTTLYSQFINGTNKKLLYRNTPRFQHKLLKSPKRVLILQRDGILLFDENGQNSKRVFTSPKGKRIGEDSWQVSGDEKVLPFTLFDDDSKVVPIAYLLDLSTENFSIREGSISSNFSNSSEALSPSGSKKAIIKEGSLFVDNKEIIHWPNYDDKFNPGCGYLKWLPFENFLSITCAGSLRIVEINSGRHAELDKGWGLDWFE